MIYDLIIIGAGPAGYLAAERAGHEGLNALLIEKRFIGGVCLNEGCVPSKALLYSAKVFDNAKHGEHFGVTTTDAKIDQKFVIERKNKVVKTLVTGIKSQLKKSKVTIVEGSAEINRKNNDGFEIKVGNDFHTGKRLLIAAGSSSIIPSIPGIKEGLEKGYVLTNREIFDILNIPSSLVIIGGGATGLEMASYFNSAGCKVTIIEMLPNIAGQTDKEISEILMKNYQKKGIDFKLNSKVIEVKEGSLAFESNGQKLTISAEKILLSVGRKAVTEGFGLEKIGVEIERERIKTDERGKTNVAEVYAAGDINGVSMLAHTAYREAEVCINTILGRKDIMRYDAIPSVIYTNPEVGGVGETEDSAKQKGIDFEVSKISMMYSSRYLAENEVRDGICKILIGKKLRTIIGVHMIGNYSSEIIYGAALMIENQMRVSDIKELVFPHPSVSEIIREGIFQF